MSITRQIKFNVTLSADEKKKVQAHVIDKRNRVAACDYAGIRTSRLDEIMGGATLKNDERDLLIDFCGIVEGK